MKWDHPRTILAKFGLIWFSGFRGEDLNVKDYDIRRSPCDGKSSHGLWSCELKMFDVKNGFLRKKNLEIYRSEIDYSAYLENVEAYQQDITSINDRRR